MGRRDDLIALEWLPLATSQHLRRLANSFGGTLGTLPVPRRHTPGLGTPTEIYRDTEGLRNNEQDVPSELWAYSQIGLFFMNVWYSGITGLHKTCPSSPACLVVPVCGPTSSVCQVKQWVGSDSASPEPQRIVLRNSWAGGDVTDASQVTSPPTSRATRDCDVPQDVSINK